MKTIFLQFITVFSCLPIVTFAQVYQGDVTTNDNYQQTTNLTNLVDKHLADKKNNLAKTKKATINKSDKPLEVSESSLLANPQLLQRTMESVLVQRNISHIRMILPIYQQMNNADSVLIDYAQALIHHDNGEFQQAIVLYRKILADEPDLFPIRYDLAMALYQNQQFGNALQQFEKLQAVSELPPLLAMTVKSAIQAIKQQEDWHFFVNGYFRKEKNINNAPNEQKKASEKGEFTFDKPEKATGVHLDLSASKRLNFANDFYSNFNARVNSNYFWDNKKYNDVNLHTGVTLGRENGKLTTEITPFIEKRLFANRPYSSTGGIKAYNNYQVNDKMSVSNTTSLSYEKFDKRKHLDGQRQFTNFTAFYAPNAQQYGFAGMNFYNNKAEQAEDNFTNQGVYLGWGQEWNKGISSKVLLSASQKNYKGIDLFAIKREDKNYGAELSLWHRALQFHNLTPKFVVSWKKTDSNHFYYDDKEDVKANIELSSYF